MISPVAKSISQIPVKTLNQIMDDAKWRKALEAAPSGDTYRDLSTIIIIPTRGSQTEKGELNCKKCKTKNEYERAVISGIDYRFFQAFRNLIRPMNVPVLEMFVPGMEVGAAYSQAIEGILGHPQLKNFKYILTIEDDNLIPFIPGTAGPMMMLYETMEKGFDVVGGLYWTKGDVSMPLIYGDPKEGRKNPAGMFKVIFPDRTPVNGEWKEGNIVTGAWRPGDIVSCNGMGCGFTLFKMDIFKDTRIKRPFFQTLSDHSKKGPRQYTQDLQFFEKARKLGYRVAIDTRIRVAHLDVRTGQVY